MKIRLTIEVTDKDRLLFGAKLHGKLTPATREEIIEVVLASVDETLAHDREVFDKHTEEIIKAIKQSSPSGK